MVTPESSFLAWINVGKLGKSSEIVDYLVKEAKVAVNDGHAYGPIPVSISVSSMAA
jgi:bifunctional pyridoxal-dependent enzyme with beta-cystathionase and maltose regulon repressor activities